jgi:flagellar biosynthesis protein FlhA
MKIGNMKIADIAISGLILGIVLVIILPIPTWLLDMLLIMNITFSIFIMLSTLYIKSALEFSILPTLLLITTLFRLSLNLASTKLILGNSGFAGQVIQTFGKFVIGGNIVVGIISFVIIIAIQFVVITKGAERVSEVAARFTLDAMPGKQMAIDADLNTGVIDEATAKQRRLDIQHEADFYGAMDGASKFVKGDAILAIIITIVNIVGGLIIGVVINGEAITDAVGVYTLSTVGDGLVSQIPALLISTSTGIVVTRSGSESSFGTTMAKQLMSNPTIMMLCGIILALLALVPGFPHIEMLLLAGVLAFVGYRGSKKKQQKEDDEKQREAMVQNDSAEAVAAEKRKPEDVMNLLKVQQLELEFGYGIVPLVDVSLGGDLLERLIMIRRQCAIDLGIVLPSIRLRDNVQLPNNQYIVKIKGAEVARGEIMPDHFLAINSDNADETITGIEAVDPAFGLPALWITKKQRERAELLGYTTIDPPSVITTHLIEVIKSHAFELLDRQQVQMLVENLGKQQPALVEEVVPKMFTYGEIQKVLMGLLRENVPIKNLGVIVETLADYGHTTKNIEELTEFARQALSRVITTRFLEDEDVVMIALDNKVEQMIAEKTKKTDTGFFTSLDPGQLERLFQNVKNIIEKLNLQGKTPVIVTSPGVRPRFKKLMEQILPTQTVLSYSEIDQSKEMRIEAIIDI